MNRARLRPRGEPGAPSAPAAGADALRTPVGRRTFLRQDLAAGLLCVLFPSKSLCLCRSQCGCPSVSRHVPGGPAHGLRASPPHPLHPSVYHLSVCLSHLAGLPSTICVHPSLFKSLPNTWAARGARDGALVSLPFRSAESEAPSWLQTPVNHLNGSGDIWELRTLFDWLYKRVLRFSCIDI